MVIGQANRIACRCLGRLWFRRGLSPGFKRLCCGRDGRLLGGRRGGGEAQFRLRRKVATGRHGAIGRSAFGQVLKNLRDRNRHHPFWVGREQTGKLHGQRGDQVVDADLHFSGRQLRLDQGEGQRNAHRFVHGFRAAAEGFGRQFRENGREAQLDALGAGVRCRIGLAVGGSARQAGCRLGHFHAAACRLRFRRGFLSWRGLLGRGLLHDANLRHHFLPRENHLHVVPAPCFRVENLRAKLRDARERDGRLAARDVGDQVADFHANQLLHVEAALQKLERNALHDIGQFEDNLPVPKRGLGGHCRLWLVGIVLPSLFTHVGCLY